MIPKKDYMLPREREMDLVPEIWNSISETGSTTKKWHGIKVAAINNFFINRKCFCIYEKKDWDRVGKFILDKFIREPAYFKKIWKLHRKFGREGEKYVWKTLKRIDDFSLKKQLQALHSLKKHWLTLDQVNVLPWFLAAEILREYIQNRLTHLYSISPHELETLWAANSLSAVAMEEVELYKSTLDYKSGKNIKILSKKLSRRFGWIPFGYDGPTFWDSAYYQKRILGLSNKQTRELKNKISEIKNQVAQTTSRQRRIIAKKIISRNLIRLLDIQQKLYIMTDERKKVQFQIHYAYHQLLKELAKSSSLTLQELKYLETAEVLEMFDNKAFLKYKKNAQNRIKFPIHLYSTNGKIRSIEYGKNVGNKLYRYVFKGGDIVEFMGATANIGGGQPLKGRVRRIMSSREIGKMKKGEILVTAMTSPDFVPAMRIAKAIITDEGGITSHAAIVSRELKVPCIIGTKIATQVLQDGDRIEVDTRRGTIKKL